MTLNCTTFTRIQAKKTRACPFASCTPIFTGRENIRASVDTATSASSNCLETSRRINKNDALRNSRESRVSRDASLAGESRGAAFDCP